MTSIKLLHVSAPGCNPQGSSTTNEFVLEDSKNGTPWNSVKVRSTDLQAFFQGSERKDDLTVTGLNSPNLHSTRIRTRLKWSFLWEM